jgi:hypothetical protein
MVARRHLRFVNLVFLTTTFPQRDVKRFLLLLIPNFLGDFQRA